MVIRFQVLSKFPCFRMGIYKHHVFRVVWLKQGGRNKRKNLQGRSHGNKKRPTEMVLTWFRLHCQPGLLLAPTGFGLEFLVGASSSHHPAEFWASASSPPLRQRMLLGYLFQDNCKIQKCQCKLLLGTNITQAAKFSAGLQISVPFLARGAWHEGCLLPSHPDWFWIPVPSDFPNQVFLEVCGGWVKFISRVPSTVPGSEVTLL